MELKPAAWLPRLTAAFIVLALAAGAGAARADVAFIIDRETLNDLLRALVTDRVEVQLGPERSLTVMFDDLRITGLDPGAGEEGQGHILTSLDVRIPDLGIDLTVKPRISLNVVKNGAASLLELRFEELVLPLPITGSINIASLVPPIRYDTDAIWQLAGARGNVPIDSRLKEVVLGRDAIRFMFEVEVLGVEP